MNFFLNRRPPPGVWHHRPGGFTDLNSRLPKGSRMKIELVDDELYFRIKFLYQKNRKQGQHNHGPDGCIQTGQGNQYQAGQEGAGAAANEVRRVQG